MLHLSTETIMTNTNSVNATVAMSYAKNNTKPINGASDVGVWD